jgi:hypothetical protein
MIVFAWLRLFWQWICSRFGSDLHIHTQEGFDMPSFVARNTLLRLTVKGEDWMAGMNCPCGCGDIIELMLLKGMHPRWEIKVDALGRPTLSPSVFRTEGCKSHFWIKGGQIVWCK